jgi:branched-chain amino acid transport system permease protein
VIDFETLLSSLISGVLLGGVLALTALGLSIVLGVMRLVNLAHGEFLVGGAYATLFLVQVSGIDPLIGVLFVGVGIAVVAVPLQRALLAPVSGAGADASMMTTFGISIILQNAFIYFFSADTRSIDHPFASLPLRLGPITVPLIYAVGCALAVVIILIVHVLISRTAFGRDLRASAIDPGAAASVGVDVRRVHTLTLALGAGCAAIGGTLIGIVFAFTPTSGASYLLTDFAIVVLGGLGNIFGTLVAGLLLGALQSIGGALLGDGYRELVGLVLFLVVLAFRPHGIAVGSAR